VHLAAELIFPVLHTTADGIVRAGGRDRRITLMLDLIRAWLRTPPSKPRKKMAENDD
jgi:hypothetical protein